MLRESMVNKKLPELASVNRPEIKFLLLVNRFIYIISIQLFQSSGADTGGVDRVDIHPPFFSKKRIRNVTLFEVENKERKKNELSLMYGCCYATFCRLPPLFAQKFARKPFDNA